MFFFALHGNGCSGASTVLSKEDLNRLHFVKMFVWPLHPISCEAERRKMGSGGT